MHSSTQAILGTGISFQQPEMATRFGYDGCDMQATLLPAGLRRRTSVATKVAFAAAERACRDADIDPATLPVIFTSSLGEIDVTDRLCSDIAAQNFPLSPTRFHNSVHNTASGYWSIAVGNRHPAMAMAAYQDSFALALLEAFSQLQTVEEKVLLVCFEETPPQSMMPGNDWTSCAVALVLAAEQASQVARARMSMPHCDQVSGDAPAYDTQSPVLAALPLLTAIRGGVAGTVQISPSGGNTWFAEVMR